MPDVARFAVFMTAAFLLFVALLGNDFSRAVND
jgi:hypothetical protein